MVLRQISAIPSIGQNRESDLECLATHLERFLLLLGKLLKFTLCSNDRWGTKEAAQRNLGLFSLVRPIMGGRFFSSLDREEYTASSLTTSNIVTQKQPHSTGTIWLAKSPLYSHFQRPEHHGFVMIGVAAGIMQSDCSIIRVSLLILNLCTTF